MHRTYIQMALKYYKKVNYLSIISQKVVRQLVPFLGDPHKEGVFEGTVCGVKVTLFINCHITFY